MLQRIVPEGRDTGTDGYDKGDPREDGGRPAAVGGGSLPSPLRTVPLLTPCPGAEAAKAPGALPAESGCPARGKRRIPAMRAGALHCHDLKQYISLAPSPDTVPRCCCSELPADTALSWLFAPPPPINPAGLPSWTVARLPGFPGGFPHGREAPLGTGTSPCPEPALEQCCWMAEPVGTLSHTGNHPGAAHPSCVALSPLPTSSLCAYICLHLDRARNTYAAVNTSVCKYTSGETVNDGCFVSGRSTHIPNQEKRLGDAPADSVRRGVPLPPPAPLPAPGGAAQRGW